MAKRLFQFGDQETADIKLRLIDENGDETNIYLHSQVLKETILYEAWLSQGRSLNEQPLELKINVSAEIFLKCFELMYSCEADEHFCFSGVDETLDILPVLSQMIFHKGVKQCMKYLNAVRWSPEQESKLRATLSSLRINILPELAVRLCISRDRSSCGDLDMLKQTLQDMLSTISCRSNNREVEKYIVGFFEAAKKSSVKAIAETCRDTLLEEFRANVERIKVNEFSEAEEVAVNAWSNLLWLFDVIRGCDGKLYRTFIELFCADGYLRYSAKYSRIGVKIKVDILLDRILNAIGNGEIINSASFRVSFLTNWLDTMVMLIADQPMHPEKLWALERGIIDVADTLSLPHQKIIYNIWKDVFNRLSMDQSNALKWWAQKVQDAIKNGKIIDTTA